MLVKRTCIWGHSEKLSLPSPGSGLGLALREGKVDASPEPWSDPVYLPQQVTMFPTDKTLCGAGDGRGEVVGGVAIVPWKVAFSVTFGQNC